MPAQRACRSTRPARRFRRSALAAGLAAAVLLSSAASASAETLVQLYELARGYDATFLAARAIAESAEYRAAQADALKRPNVALGGGVTQTRADPPSSSSSRQTNNQQLSVNARQALFNREDDKTIAQAYRALESAQASLEVAEQDLIVRVSQAYFDVLAAQDALETTRAAKKAITEQLASAKRNFEVGTATITDTREAQARYDLATAQEIAAENDLATRRATLDQLVGRPGVAPSPLAPPARIPQLLMEDLPTWLARSEGAHPVVRQASLALDIARLETEKARAGHLPTVDLVGSVGTSHSTGSGVVAQGGREGTTRSASLGVQLSLPLYAGHAVQNRIRETLLLEERSRNDLEGARRSVALATRTAYLGVQSGQAQVLALEAAESSNQLALEATLTGYRVGVRVNLDVLNAQTQLFQTRRDLARARYDVLVNALRLRQAAGQLQPQDLAPINALLVP